MWTKPYLATGTPEPGARAAIAWNHRSHRYVLVIAIALTGIAEISSALTDTRFRVLVTTRDQRVLGLSEPERTLRALSPVRELRESALRAAIAVEPSEHRTLWRFRRGDRTRWAGRALLERRQQALSIYVIQASDE